MDSLEAIAVAEAAEAKPRPRKFALRDRLNLQMLVPKAGRYGEMAVWAEILRKVGLSRAEYVQYGIANYQLGADYCYMTWANYESSETWEYKLSDVEEKYVRKALEELDGQVQMSVGQVRLYEMFCL